MQFGEIAVLPGVRLLTASWFDSHTHTLHVLFIVSTTVMLVFGLALSLELSVLASIKVT